MPTSPKSSGIRDNHYCGSVGDFLKPYIQDKSRLSVVSAYFTIYAYEALKDWLDRIEHMSFLFGEPTFVKSLDPSKTETKAFVNDVLIGLDLSNRLPVLEVLETTFVDYQILLSTFDRVWFEMAQLQTQGSGRWVYQELFTESWGTEGLEIPVLKSGHGYLKQAKKHLQGHDFRAAAVYARAAFETKLQKFCSKNRLPVPYNKDKRKITAEDFWRAVTGQHGGDGKSHVDKATKGQVEALRRIVLNPLSHAGASTITSAEVQKAIKVIETLTLL
jgi:hypothetical protein